MDELTIHRKHPPSLLDDIWRDVTTHLPAHRELCLRAAWKTEYRAEVGAASSPLHLRHMTVDVDDRIGSAYYEPDAEPTLATVALGPLNLERGRPAGAFGLALLDALAAHVAVPPQRTHQLTGNSAAMAVARANIVAAETLATVSAVPQPRIALIGVVGEFIRAFRDSGSTVVACDNYPPIVGSTIDDVLVQSGQHTLKSVADADVALVTGMTLSNGTFGAISQVAGQCSTKLVLFAQTAAHLGPWLLSHGATTVIGEPYPYYLSGAGYCAVDCYSILDSLS